METHGKRIDPRAHRQHDWKVEEIAPDFALIDAWMLPVVGAQADFAEVQAMFREWDPAQDEGSWISRALFSLRLKLGALLGWDDPTAALPIPGCTETSLRSRLAPGEASAEATGGAGPEFSPVFETDREFASEISNSTVHAVLHVGWVPETEGQYRAQMGVYVKTRGRFGDLYMALIAPFRHWIVYPALMRTLGRMWEARRDRVSAASPR